MDRFKALLLKLLRPSVKAVLLIDILAMPLVIAALSLHKSADPLSLSAYLLSAYALTVTVINFKRTVHRIKGLVKGDELALVRGIKGLMRKNKYTKRYLESKDFRAEVSLYTGLAINLFFACFKGATGASERSAWEFSLGVYYFFLAAIRFTIMLGVLKRNRSELPYSQRKLYEYKKYRLCGGMVMVLNLAVSGMAIQMIWQNKANEYSQTQVIASAAFTFYCFISAIAKVVSFRKRDNAILSAARSLSLIAALMSMFSLQTSMLRAFSKGNDGSFRRTMNTVTGISVLTLVLGIATFMIVIGTKKIREYEKQTVS